jgi:SPP1 family predicted phage head-tail adaptor
MTVNQQLPGAGKLDTRIALLRPITTVDAAGAHITEFETVAETWANVRQITFRESMKLQVELQTETYTIMIRYRTGITPAWCVNLRGKRYRILTINADRSAGQIILGVELDNSITQEVET